MAILVDGNTKLVVQGITGREGTFHATRNKAYGTNVVAGVTPGKAGQDVEGIPVFNTVRDAVETTGANTAMVFVPPRFATDALYEALESGVDLVICVTEGIPAHDMLRAYTHLKRGNQVLIGPNCPGIISPGKATVGIMPTQVFNPGRVGLVSRSGTLTYQISKELALLGIGQSTVVGIGGDRMAPHLDRRLAHVKDLGVVGFVEVLKHLPALNRLFKQVVAAAREERVAAALFIDYPGFNLRLARALRDDVDFSCRHRGKV